MRRSKQAGGERGDGLGDDRAHTAPAELDAQAAADRTAADYEDVGHLAGPAAPTRSADRATSCLSRFALIGIP
jgi:hypothetical protein